MMKRHLWATPEVLTLFRYSEETAYTSSPKIRTSLVNRAAVAGTKGILRVSTMMLAIGTLTAGDAMAIERLAYRTIEREGQIEIRRSQPHVVAETFVDGDFERVGNEGFRRLVGYIGGANRSQAKISMTAPVVQEKVGDRYRITFLMPSKYTLETLPQPTDTRIRLRTEEMSSVAAIRYSGFWSRSRYDDHEHKLREWIDQRGLEPISEPVWARYDPPFMPWFLRRNEILIELRDPGAETAREERDQ
jgi:hypothetical protein